MVCEESSDWGERTYGRKEARPLGLAGAVTSSTIGALKGIHSDKLSVLLSYLYSMTCLSSTPNLLEI